MSGPKYTTVVINVFESNFNESSCPINEYTCALWDRGGTVVKVLCYKSEGRWFDPSWSQWNFSFTLNPSDRTMALGSTQTLTEMSTRSISWG